MASFYSLLRKGSLGVILVLVQACTQDIPSPNIASDTKQTKNDVKQQAINARETEAFDLQNDDQYALFKRIEHKVANTSSKGDFQTQLLDGQCVDVFDVYYNLATGEPVREVYIGRKCSGTSNPGTGGDSGGGSDGPTGPAGTGSGATQAVYSQLPPCANNVLSNLLASAASGGQSNLLDAVLSALQMSGSTMAVHFVTESSLAPNVSGDCRQNVNTSNSTGINDFDIRINPAYLNGGTNGGATDLFVAQIIVHEVLHAALMDWALTHGSSANGVSFDNLLGNFMAMQGLAPGDNQGQHDAMSLIVGQLGGALYNYYTHTTIDHSGSLGAQNNQNVLTPEDCTYLCWTGLEGTVGYQYAVSNDAKFKPKCDAIHGAELKNKWVATGSQADGTLQQRYPAGTDPCP